MEGFSPNSPASYFLMDTVGNLYPISAGSEYSDTAQCYIISAVYIPAISKMLHGMKEQMFLIILLIIVFFMTLLWNL